MKRATGRILERLWKRIVQSAGPSLVAAGVISTGLVAAGLTLSAQAADDSPNSPKSGKSSGGGRASSGGSSSGAAASSSGFASGGASSGGSAGGSSGGSSGGVSGGRSSSRSSSSVIIGGSGLPGPASDSNGSPNKDSRSSRSVQSNSMKKSQTFDSNSNKRVTKVETPAELVEITEMPNKISVKIENRTVSPSKSKTVTAADVNELKRKHPDAYERYRDHVENGGGGVKAMAGGGARAGGAAGGRAGGAGGGFPGLDKLDLNLDGDLGDNPAARLLQEELAKLRAEGKLDLKLDGDGKPDLKLDGKLEDNEAVKLLREELIKLRDSSDNELQKQAIEQMLRELKP